jgi:hypothetical protein
MEKQKAMEKNRRKSANLTLAPQEGEAEDTKTR